MDIEKIKKDRDAHIDSIFALMIQIAFIFGIPAALSVIIGKYAEHGQLAKFIPFFLTFSFILSWSIVLYIYRQNTKKLKWLEEKIRQNQKTNV